MARLLDCFVDKPEKVNSRSFFPNYYSPREREGMIQWRARGLFKDSILQHLLLYDYLLLLFKNNRKGIFKRDAPSGPPSVVINASQKTSSASTINLMFCTTKMDHYCIFFFSSHLTNCRQRPLWLYNACPVTLERSMTPAADYSFFSYTQQ